MAKTCFHKIKFYWSWGNRFIKKNRKDKSRKAFLLKTQAQYVQRRMNRIKDFSILIQNTIILV